MICFSNDEKRDRRVKKYILITTILLTAFSLLLVFILGITIPALLFTMLCVPCIGVLTGALLSISTDYIKFIFEE